MAIEHQTVVYDGPGGPFERVVVRPGLSDRVSGVLVAPTWMGQSAFEVEKAERLTEQGYVAFAIDLYGRGLRPRSQTEAAAAMSALDSDRALLQARMEASLDRLRSIDQVDGSRVAAVGYCFGGKCVLDLAGAGASVAAIASFHGAYDAPANISKPRILAKALILPGWDDPLAPPEALRRIVHRTDRKRG